jgi:4-methylaminobutanoate oxidase (formaldehyde-forming)
VALDKPGGFIGRDALVKAKAAGAPRRRIVQFTLDDAEPVLWGGELILRDGKAVGEVRSAAYGHTLGRSVALGLVEAETGVEKAFIESGRFEIDLAGRLYPATAHLKSPYDPKSERPKADIAELRAAAA